MPLIDVEIVLEPGEALADGLAVSLADAIGATLAAPAGHTWVRLWPIEPGGYSEGSGVSGQTPAPVFVTVLQAQLPTEAKLEQRAAALAKAVARVCGRAPDAVHIVFRPEGRGRVAFGGKLLRDRA
jgi:phenylpyruvate tautomerase PptA (4-oxalocrotonate tautomerase family)